MPVNPTWPEELGEIPEVYSKTATRDKFGIYDSLHDDDDFSEGLAGRVIVFATRRNVELLAASRIWFLDETFKVN